MSETTTTTVEATTETPATTPASPPATTDTGAALLAQLEKLKADNDKWQAMSRKWEGQSKANADAAKQAETLKAELEQVRAAGMSDHEKALTKAVKEAEAKGRTEAMGAVGQRLVRAEFRALSAGVVPDLDGVLDDLNLAKFIDSNGEPDTKAIEAAVKRLTPPPPPAQPDQSASSAPGPRADLTQGPRQTMALNGDPLLASLKTKLNIP